MNIDNQNPSKNKCPAKGYLDISQQKLVITEDDLTQKRFNDRDKVVEMIESLANRTFEALAKDQADNMRYARTLNLSNKNRNDANRNKPFHRELIEVPLPVQSICWNDLDVNDIQYLMLERIRQIHDGYSWYKTRVELGSFFDQATKDLVDHELKRFEEENPPESSTERVRRRTLKKRKVLKAAPVTVDPIPSNMTPTLPQPVRHHVPMREISGTRGEQPQQPQQYSGRQFLTPLDSGTVHQLSQIDTVQATRNVETPSQEAPTSTVVSSPEMPVESSAQMTSLGIVPVPKKRGRPRKNVESSGANVKVKKPRKNNAGVKRKVNRRKKVPAIEANDDDDDEVEILYEDIRSNVALNTSYVR